MRIENLEVEVFNYNELCEESKQVVKQFVLDGRESEFFSEDCNYHLQGLFPNSDLNVQFSLNSCQGDGLNIYGRLDFEDCLNIAEIKRQFNQNELNTLQEYFNYEYSYELEQNDRYCYCIIDRQNITENLFYELEDNELEIDESLLEKFNDAVKRYLCGMCKELEKDGYNYFYEIEESEIIEVCEMNEYEFLEDGRLYA